MLRRTITQLHSPRFTQLGPGPACESDVKSHSGMACHSVPRTCMVVAVREQHSIPTRTLPVLREQFQPAARSFASRRNTNHTSTDCDVMATWILAPNQNVARAQESFSANMNSEKTQTLNTTLLTLRGQFSNKWRTSCVASHSVRLLATCPFSGQETAPVTYGSALDRCRSA